MNVMYASDDNYAWLMGISMISLFGNDWDSKEVHVFLFGERLSKENEEILVGIAESKNYVVIPMNPLHDSERRWAA